ncbi:MAG: alpha/beta hydrolase [Nitrospirae bacterium GWC2_56_14]|nr:MAG: alpha/beta hydrolase [Nitrospirae bacterium GWC2_56_14]
MPIIQNSRYRPPRFFSNGHLQTIYPSVMRRLEHGFYDRERIETIDDDFLDIDWVRRGNNRVAVLSHGLEGNSHRPYMVGMAKMLNRHGWDVAAWNYRSCSGEMNRQVRFYHNGSIDDLDRVVEQVLSSGAYQSLALIGFSLGGNLTLLYLGSQAHRLDSRIRKAIAFSAPCNLRSSANELARPVNRLYLKQFLDSLHAKIRIKQAMLPGLINDDDFQRVKNFKDFDDRYTAPIHGFKDAEDYWSKCSSGQFLPMITIPTLIVNAMDDPFLADGCYPVQEASRSTSVHLETPASGGHLGFVQFNEEHCYWSEERAMEFLESSDTA